jgi:hypothetical protein
MKIKDEIMHFRNERARELEMVAELLERHIESGISAPLWKAIGLLKDDSFVLPFKDGRVDRNTWGYEIEGFTFRPAIPKHIKPNVTDLSITLNIKIIANCADWENLNDPLQELSFKAILRGLGDKDYYTGFHIDRHDGGTNPEGEIHPVYHLQYLVNPNNDHAFEYGTALSLDTPRIMHYPMEFVLGLGYLTANYFPLAYETLLDDGFYYQLFKDYQARIWKPYSHTMAYYWKPLDESSIAWNPALICPYFLD